MTGLALYGVYVRASIKMQMAYPGSFLMLSLAQLLVTTIEFFGLYLLFARFGRLDAWSLGEVAFFYALVSIAFAIADTITRGFDVFGPEFVKTGNFDRLLLRPRAAWLQLLGHEFRLTRIGRFLQGAAVLAIGAHLLHFAWTAQALALAVFSILGAVALFSGLLILQATLSFWTVESLEIMNTMTYGGVEAAQVPMSIYARWLRDFLTYVVPLACVSYFPVLAMLGKAGIEGMSAPAAMASPVFGFVFLGVALWVWGFGVRRYTSTGS
jgi:ABC-2 type transport system permease protein